MPVFKGTLHELPDDEPIVVVVKEIEDTEGTPFKGKETDPKIPQIKVTFEVVDEGDFKGHRILQWFNTDTYALRSKIRKFTYAAAGVEDIKNEDVEIDTDELVGAKLIVLGDHGEEGDKNWRMTKFKVFKAGKGRGSRNSTKPLEDKAAAARGEQADSAPAQAPVQEQREPVAAAPAPVPAPAAANNDLDF